MKLIGILHERPRHQFYGGNFGGNSVDIAPAGGTTQQLIVVRADIYLPAADGATSDANGRRSVGRSARLPTRPTNAASKEMLLFTGLNNS
jgi:hypothetical protein